MRFLASIPRLAAACAVRLVKLGLLTALVGGIPYGLLTQIGVPIPRTLPSIADIPRLLTTPVTDTLVLALLADALWILWAAFTISVLAELAAALRGTPAPRLPTIAPMQALAGWLVAGVTIGVVSSGSLVGTATVDPPPAVTSVEPHPGQPAYDQMLRTGHATVTITPAQHTTAGHDEMIVLIGSQRHTVTVTRGDTLSHLARDWLGDPNRWPEIYQLNRGRSFPDVGGRLTNPNLIYPGWVLDLPPGARPPGTPDPCAPAPSSPAPSTPQQPATPQLPAPTTPASPGSTPSTPPSSAPSPSMSAAAQDPDGVIGDPAPTPSTSAASSASPSTGDSPTAVDRRPSDDGIDLPGGWITLPLAIAITTAAALVWLRRRHRWIPEPFDAEPDDNDLRPSPPVVTRIRRTVRATAPQLLPPADPQPRTPVDRPPADDELVGLPPIGPSGPELAGLGTGLPAGGLGITGPGAEAAARALLAATLSAGGPADPDASGRVVIPADALTTLLGTHAVDTTGIPRLTVTPNLPDALTHVEESLIERRRTLLDYGVDDLDGIRAADPYYPPMPPILLIAETPPPPTATRVSSTLQLGAPLQISGILLGGWRGEAITIGADGRSSPDRRLSVLDLATTVDLLGVLREAHTGQPATAPEPAVERDLSDTPPDLAPAASPKPDPSAWPEPAVAPTADESPQEEREPAGDAGDGPAPQPDSTGEPGPTAQTPGDPPVAVVEPTPRRQALVRVLGVPTICDAEGNPIRAVRHHAQQLLVYLVIFRPGADRTRICHTFWPAADQRLAGGSLNTEASELRKYLRQAVGDPGVNPVVNPGGRYVLNPETVTVDAWRLVDALREARAAADPEVKIAALRRAVDTHTGILAEGCDYEWIAEPRERMRRRGIRARIGLADLITDIEPERAADLLRAAAGLDPYSDELTRRAMRAYAHLGNVEAIRRQLGLLRQALEEINEEPAEETENLASTLVCQLTRAERHRSLRHTRYDTE
ncbi:MAG: LysM peptidoglycan-binding domain-containing protein [Dactylosporangium sp.]|nr:LysM peptidoglycan-binding domain-containing protein [Dactylosporangium sp.]NNJ62333.1 LysM peptidoglycan-binding domain-containing protein [Dactylosporangium sp.]